MSLNWLFELYGIGDLCVLSIYVIQLLKAKPSYSHNCHYRLLRNISKRRLCFMRIRRMTIRDVARIFTVGGVLSHRGAGTKTPKASRPPKARRLGAVGAEGVGSGKGAVPIPPKLRYFVWKCIFVHFHTEILVNSCHTPSDNTKLANSVRGLTFSLGEGTEAPKLMPGYVPDDDRQCLW